MKLLKNSKTAILTAIVFSLIINVSSAYTIRYVKSGQSGNGSSWTNASGNLQQMINASASGDQVWVSRGLYIPTEKFGGTTDRHKTFHMKAGVKIYGGFPASGDPNFAQRDPSLYASTLSGDLDNNDFQGFGTNENSYHVIYNPSSLNLSSTALLDGFYIYDGHANSSGELGKGAGIYNSNCDPTISNCKISDCNAADKGGGIYNYNSQPNISNCTFENNRADYGAAAAGLSADASYVNCVFNDNESTEKGGAAYLQDSDTIFTSCEFVDNYSEYGGAMYCNDNHSVGNYFKITNCVFRDNDANYDGGAIYNYTMYSFVINSTIINNTCNGHGGGIYNYQSNPQPQNCILWYNESGDSDITDQQVYYISGSSDIRYSAVQGGYGDVNDHNIDAEPKITRYGRLFADSPCIDAGRNNAVPSGITTDKSGISRFCDNYYIEDTGNGTAPIVDIGAYESRHFHVDPNATGSNNGDSWANAYTDLQDALNNAIAGDAILISAGTYIPDTNNRSGYYLINSGLHLYGGYDTSDAQEPNLQDSDPENYPTIFSGDINVPGDINDNFYHVIGIRIPGISGGTTLFEGITITGGNANSTNMFMYADKNGGAVYGSDLKFVDCNLCDNYAERYGGAVYSTESLVIENSTIKNNSTSDIGNGGGVYHSGDFVMADTTVKDNASRVGGGISVTTSGSEKNPANCPVISNSLFLNNTATYGGGLSSYRYGDYIGDEQLLINCRFISNDANHGGAIQENGHLGNYANNLFVSNNAENGGGIYFVDSNSAVINCTFADNIADNGDGIYCCSDMNMYPSDININNCILWNNSDSNEIDNIDNSTIKISYSDIKGGWTGTGSSNLIIDPCFYDANGKDNIIGTEDDDYRVLVDSNCIDAGDNNALVADFSDIDGDGNTVELTPLDLAGQKRIDKKTPTVVDIGAYEFNFNIADIDTDGDVDLADFVDLANDWQDNGNGDIAPADEPDQIVDFLDLKLLFENWLFGHDLM